MKNSIRIILLIAAAIACPVIWIGAAAPAAKATGKAAAKSAPSTPGTPAQSERIAREIDLLLGHRRNPEPLPLVLPNPFLIVAGAGAARGAEAGAAAARDDGGRGSAEAEFQFDPSPTGSAAALARYASTLRIGGVLRMSGQPTQVVINGISRKESDIITARLDNSTVRIQVARILQNELVLKLGDAELTVRF